MKKIIYIVLALVGMGLFTGCGSSEKKGTPTAISKHLAGEWHLTSWTGPAPEVFDAYLAFNADNTFVIYQKIEQVHYQKFTGKYTLKKTTLSGIYDDNVVWGTVYDAQVDQTGDIITLTSSTNVAEVSVYTRTAIPQSVKDDVVKPQTAPVGRATEFRLL